ncbi:hypothetical protein GJQ54_02665 [Oceanospirillaceae bacterium ASx5O]|nr:hypothetical protein GJQ54_02665 [Oceanospirillaceae bacterium ASx5O]
MVKKTLLSLAIAATAAGLAGCNVSTTDKYDNKIINEGVDYLDKDQASAYPIFAPEAAKLPLAIDFLFADAATSDGTANTADTTPPVTTAINKLDGFSLIAPIYIEFSADLDPATVKAGQTVFLAKMNNGTKDGKPEPLLANTNDPFSTDPIMPTDYEARVVELDGTPAIQILMKKPLAAKTKYLVILTDGIKSARGESIGQDTTYAHVLGDDGLANDALAPVRTQVKGWKQLADGFLNSGSPLVAGKSGQAIFNYTFTTGGGDDVLKAMAAPGTFLTTQMPTYAHAEGAIKGSVEKKVRANAPEETPEEDIQALITNNLAATLGQIAQGVGQKLNAANADNDDWTDLVLTDGSALRTAFINTPGLLPYYYAGLITAIASNPADPAEPTLIDNIVDKPKSRTYTPIISAPATAVSVAYDAFFTAQITPIATSEITTNVTNYWKTVSPQISESDLEGKVQYALTNGVTLVDAGGPGVNVTVPSLDDAVAAKRTVLSSQGAIYQGGLTIPNYLSLPEAGQEDAALGSWTASNNAALALGLAGAPQDVNGTTNVTYRFPFAHKLGDVTIPIMVTLPNAAACDNPAKWPVAIYQHGITVDRTAGVLVGNALAKACVAMVAIDHVMHGVGPTSATGLVFNVEQVSKNYNPSVSATAAASPFAIARAGMIESDGDSPVVNLRERHNNVGKNAAQQNVDMVFKDAVGDYAGANNVGASGDLYINLMNFSRTRDAMRQTVVDLLNLSASIGAMDVNADGSHDFDTSKVYFIGHSLGGIIGTTFVAVNNDPSVRAYNVNLPEIKAAILGNAGGGVVKLLENSPGIGALKILPGLKAAAGLEQGSANFEKFFGVFQAILDSVDPINFAYAPHMQTLPVLAYTAVGDAVVPNHALGEVKYETAVVNGALTVVGATPGAAPTAKSYLSGTDPLVKALGITKVLTSATTLDELVPNVVNGVDAKRVSIRTDKNKSDHSTFSSASPQETFAEIFGQIGSFLADEVDLGAGPVTNPLRLQKIRVQDNSVLEQVAE